MKHKLKLSVVLFLFSMAAQAQDTSRVNTPMSVPSILTTKLRFTNLKAGSTPATANGKALSVDANGDVILVPAATASTAPADPNITSLPNGYVGIGTTTPKYKLDVVGNEFYFGPHANNPTTLTSLKVSAGVNADAHLVLGYSTPTFDAGIWSLMRKGSDQSFRLINYELGTPREVLSAFSNGFVGIGTALPGNILDVGGTAGNSGLRLSGINSNTATSIAASKFLTVDANGDVVLANANASTNTSTDATIVRKDPNTGAVLIGDATMPAGYKLAIAGDIIAERAVIKLKANWPDYVFTPQYKRATLEDVETYIANHQHLPNVPAAQEVEKNGLDIAAMNIKLMEKVEELTLYLIEQNKKIQALEQAVKMLNK